MNGISLPDLVIALKQVRLAGGGDAAAIALLRHNISDFVIVDMGGDDYLMTDEEATSAGIVAVNTGGGTKKLLVPTASDGMRPLSQQVSLAFSADGLFFDTEALVGSPVFLPSTYTYIVSAIAGAGVFSTIAAYGSTIRSTMSPLRNVLNLEAMRDQDFGKLIVANDVIAQAFLINAGLNVENGVFTFTCENAAGAALTAGVGVTLIGNTAVANGQTVSVVKEADTETYRILRGA